MMIKTNAEAKFAKTATNRTVPKGMGYKNILGLGLLLVLGSCTTLSKKDKTEGMSLEKLSLTDSIKPGGNSWVVNEVKDNRHIISDKGIRDWNDKNTIIRTYFKTDLAGQLNLGLNLKVSDGI